MDWVKTTQVAVLLTLVPTAAVFLLIRGGTPWEIWMGLGILQAVGLAALWVSRRKVSSDN